MRLDKLTLKLQAALQDAISFATESGHQQVEPEHLFYTLLRQPDSIVAAISDKLGIPNVLITKIIEEDLAKRPAVSGGMPGFISQRA